MKRSFTFTMSRKVSTGAYENADVFEAEGFEVSSGEDGMATSDRAFEAAKKEVRERVRRSVDAQAQEARE